MAEFEGWKVPFDFQSDGCTWSPDRVFGVDLYPACRLHDFLRRHVVHYGVISVSEADKVFKRHLKSLGAPSWVAHLYWLGVKVIRPFFKRTSPVPFHWHDYLTPGGVKDAKTVFSRRHH